MTLVEALSKNPLLRVGCVPATVLDLDASIEDVAVHFEANPCVVLDDVRPRLAGIITAFDIL